MKSQIHVKSSEMIHWIWTFCDLHREDELKQAVLL